MFMMCAMFLEPLEGWHTPGGSDGSLITWGDPRRGGDSRSVQQQLSERLKKGVWSRGKSGRRLA